MDSVKLGKVLSAQGYRMPLGAWPQDDGATYFRVWAPRYERVAVEVTRGGAKLGRFSLAREESGYFAGVAQGVTAGDRYHIVLGDHQLKRPDPVSRWQPDGPHGASEVIAPGDYAWGDAGWRGVPRDALIIYELHVGTFTPEGNFRAAIGRLDELCELGVTAVELMPVAQSPGRWNWGYDGVNFFAPRNTYGTPDDMRAFVDACHQHGIAVLLDVVYNHLGPEGNYWADFAPYFSRKHGTPWGPAFNFDGKHRQPVRDFIVHNVLYWLWEFHVDGLRLDAVHYMYDESKLGILHEIAATVEAARTHIPWQVHLIGETNVCDAGLVAPHPQTGAKFDAIWCDDFLHAVQAIAIHERRLTNRVYHGAEDLALVLEHGYLYGSPGYSRVKHSDARPSGVTEPLVFSLQNHDVIGNHPDGDRLHHIASPEYQRAAAALLLLYPAIPMLFMGEEFSADAKFLFFVDFGDPGLRRAVVQGRAAEHPQHQWNDAVSPISEQAFVLSRPGPAAMGDQVTRTWYEALIRLRKRWKSRGLLADQRMQVRFDPTAQLFVLQYSHEHERGFVAVRLHRRGHVSVPITLIVQGQVVLQSDHAGAHTDAKGMFEVPLLLNRAIVGEGTVEWRSPSDSSPS